MEGRRLGKCESEEKKKTASERENRDFIINSE